MDQENYEGQHALRVIESSSRSFMHCCNACPAFFMGSIQDALHSAFNSTVIAERRPLLIYAHHDNSMTTESFCTNLLCNGIIIDYLLENYIVWPWNITNESNRNILVRIFEENFPSESDINLSMEQCPMLIGIMQRSPRENDPFAGFLYESKEIFAGGNLMRTFQQLNLNTLFEQLVAFKEEFDENEQYLSFDFVKKTGLCWELVLGIADYLPLNDVVTVFSSRILPLLETRLSIIRPSDEFMRTMIQKISPERIVSLRLDANDLRSTMEYPSAVMLSHILLLILDNLQHADQINAFQTYFFHVNCLSLRYNNEVDFHTLSKIVSLIRIPVKQFGIHCVSIPCSHHRMQLLYNRIPNSTIESLVLNVTHSSSSLINNCIQGHAKCLLRTVADLIKVMSHIQRVCVIINRGNIETLLDIDEWTTVVKACTQLKTITLKLMRKTSQDRQLTEKIQNIENGLHAVRQSIQFEVKVK